MTNNFEKEYNYEKEERDKLIQAAATDILNIFSTDKEAWEEYNLNIEDHRIKSVSDEIDRLLYEQGKNFTSEVIKTSIASLKTAIDLGFKERKTERQIKALYKKLEEINSLREY